MASNMEPLEGSRTTAEAVRAACDKGMNASACLVWMLVDERPPPHLWVVNLLLITETRIWWRRLLWVLHHQGRCHAVAVKYSSGSIGSSGRLCSFILI